MKLKETVWTEVTKGKITKTHNRESPSRENVKERSRYSSKESESREGTKINEKGKSSGRNEEVVSSASKKIFVDELGRVIDEKGNIIPRVRANIMI